MPALTEDIQSFIVQAHACYRKVSLIKKDVKAEFGLEMDRRAILFYHPEKGAKTKRLAKRWKELFEQKRKEFNDGTVMSGISRQAYRIALYHRGADFYEEQGNYVLAGEMAEKASKEMGGANTNRREFTGKGGGPIEQVQRYDLKNLTDAELETLERIVGKVGTTSG